MTSLIVFCAKYLFVTILACLGYVFWRATPSQRRTLVLRGLLVVILSIVLAQGGGALYQEPRPFVVQHIQPLFPHEADNGFPSDHTLLVFACAFLLLPYSRTAGGITILIGAIVGSARVASHVHSPLDIVASILFALLANVIAARSIRPSAETLHQREPESK